jgi:hypothetical protein
MKPGAPPSVVVSGDGGHAPRPGAYPWIDATVCNTLKLYWRPIFCTVVVIGSSMTTLLARETVYRTGAYRSTLVGVWLGLALLYGLLSLAAAAPSRGWRVYDVLSVALLLVTAWYEANWPGPWVNHLPESVAVPWAGVTAASTLRVARRLALQARTAGPKP